MLRPAAGVICTVVAALALASAAAADKETVRLTSAGQAAARAAVLTRADLGSAAGWTGGVTKPNLGASFTCSGFDPKQSDLVLIGAAQTTWKNTGLTFDSEASVLRTPRMVDLDWQRTVLAPQVLPCLRTMLAKQLANAGKLASFGRISFPHVAPYSRAYRAVISVPSGLSSVKLFADVVLVGRGRTEISLTTIAPLAAGANVVAAEVRLARLLAARARD